MAAGLQSSRPKPLRVTLTQGCHTTHVAAVAAVAAAAVVVVVVGGGV